MQDSWDAGDSYEVFMGRWSSRVAVPFVDWIAPAPGLRWLDVGCGSGALSEAILRQCQPADLTAVDQSRGFVLTAQRRLGDRATCRVGNALALPLADAVVDVTVSGLVLNFIPAPVQALSEMKRVTAAGGTVAVYVWDYAGQMEFLSRFWDVATDLDPAAAHLHEAARFPDSNGEALAGLFAAAGLAAVATAPLVIETRFPDFDDYWQPFLGGQGPAPTYVQARSEADRQRLRAGVQARLPVDADGSIRLRARAWAAKGVVA